jgi:hypothetical protein
MCPILARSRWRAEEARLDNMMVPDMIFGLSTLMAAPIPTADLHAGTNTHPLPNPRPRCMQRFVREYGR